jgi:hypothetical protein
MNLAMKPTNGGMPARPNRPTAQDKGKHRLSLIKSAEILNQQVFAFPKVC